MVNQQKGDRREEPVLALTITINISSSGSGSSTRMTMMMGRMTMAVPVMSGVPENHSDPHVPNSRG